MTAPPRDPIPRPLRVASELAWRTLLVAAAVVLLALLVARLRIVFLPIIVALLLATLLTPPVGWLQARRVPRGVATALVLLLAVGALVALVGNLSPHVAGELDEVDVNLESGLDKASSWLVNGPFGLEREDVREWRQQLRQELNQRGGSIAAGALGGAYLILEAAAGMLLSIVLLFFFVKDGRRMWAWVVTLFPSRARDDVKVIGELGWNALGGYLRGVTLVAAVDAIGIGVALVLLDVPLALPLALLTFLGGFFPIIGAVLAGFVAAMVALATNGVTTALLVVVATIVVQQLEGNLLQPLIVGRAVRIHPAAIILAVAVGGVLWGVAGAFIAVPLAAVVSQSLGYLRTKPKPAATLST